MDFRDIKEFNVSNVHDSFLKSFIATFKINKYCKMNNE